MPSLPAMFHLPLPPGPMFLASQFVWGVLFNMMAVVVLIYQVDVAGLNPLELVLVGTSLEISAFLFEVPTGIVADRYSRKLSVVTGYVITGFSFLLGASFPVFEVLVLSAFIWGIGWTFISGAHQAWLADEIGELDAARHYLDGQRLASVGSVIGILVAVSLGSVAIHYPYALAGILFIAWGGFAWFGMKETAFSPSPAAGLGSLSAMRDILFNSLATIRTSPTLVLLVIVGVVIGTYSEGYDRLSTAHLLRNFSFPGPWGFQPVVVFGAMALVSSLATIMGIRIIQDRMNIDESDQVGLALAIASILILLLTLLFALTGNVYIAIALYILLSPLRAICDPLTTGWINRHAVSGSRATILSIHSQSDAFGQMAGGPMVGVVGREFGIRIALGVAALLLAPAVWLYLRARRP